MRTRMQVFRLVLFIPIVALLLFWSANSDSSAGIAPAQNKIALPVKLPDPTTKGTPDDLPSGPHVETPPDPISPKLRPAFYAPAGVTNVAFGKRITCSVEKLREGKLDQLTDGLKEAIDDDVVELQKGVQWVQVDLGEDHTIYAILFWHDHSWLQVFRDVLVRTADDPQFTKNPRTIFNNDVDNSSGLGIGTDKEYFETFEGKLIDTRGMRSRYIRFYSNGSNMNENANRYQEIEIYALPAGSIPGQNSALPVNLPGKPAQQ